MNKRFILKTIYALTRLVRLINLLMIVLVQWLVSFYLIDIPQQKSAYITLASLVFCTILITAAGYIINDYHDVKIDAINKPRRVLIGRSVDRRLALVIYFALNIAGFFIGWYMLSLKIALLFLMTMVFLWWYSIQLKRLPFAGNLVVAALTALSIIIIGIHYRQYPGALFVFAGFAFVISIIREIIKDIEDMQGDATYGCQTLPIIMGLRKVKWLLYAMLFLLSFLMIVASVYLLNTLQGFFILLLLPLLFFMSVRLARADTTRHFKNLSLLCKIIMLLGTFGIVFAH